MDTLTPESLLARLQWRYATKQFDDSRKIPAEIWDGLEKALILSPSSFGMQPWKFLVVTDPEVKKSLVAASWNQTQPAGCSHFVVFAARTTLGEPEVDKYLAHTAATRGITTESLAGFRNVLVGFTANLAKEGRLKDWATNQVYIALGNFMTSCAVLGVDACPMEGISREQYDKILGLEGTGFSTVVACASGYRADADKYATTAKVRFPAGEVVRHV